MSGTTLGPVLQAGQQHSLPYSPSLSLPATQMRQGAQKCHYLLHYLGLLSAPDDKAILLQLGRLSSVTERVISLETRFLPSLPL